MKIGFHGNPGNYPLMLARALRRLGHEVVFTLGTTAALDRPESRYEDLGPPYPDWILDFAPLWDSRSPTPSRARCIEALRECDVVILSHLGPSLAAEIGRPHVALLTGSDLLRDAVTDERQREGIARAALVTHFARGLVPEGDRLLDSMGVEDSRRLQLLMTEPDRIAREPAPRNARIRTFNAARLNWKRPLPPGHAELDMKGTDVMVCGIGLFTRKHGPCLDVRLVRKGLHVEETMRLVADEGFAGQVTWLDEMSQRAVQGEFRDADILFDQLGSSVVAMAGLDGMATGRPVIANARPEITEPVVGEPSPICQARTPQEVAAQLERLAFDPMARERAGEASRRYVERRFSSEGAARRLLKRLAGAMR